MIVYLYVCFLCLFVYVYFLICYVDVGNIVFFVFMFDSMDWIFLRILLGSENFLGCFICCRIIIYLLYVIGFIFIYCSLFSNYMLVCCSLFF